MISPIQTVAPCRADRLIVLFLRRKFNPLLRIVTPPQPFQTGFCPCKIPACPEGLSCVPKLHERKRENFHSPSYLYNFVIILQALSPLRAFLHVLLSSSVSHVLPYHDEQPQPSLRSGNAAAMSSQRLRRWNSFLQ